MRRIASVFGSRRSDKQDAAPTTPSIEHSDLSRDSTIKKKPGVLNSLSRKALHPTMPQLLPSIPANSSSSSASSGSTALRTPEDEPLSRSLSKKNWKSWMGGKKPAGMNGLRNEWDPKLDWEPLPAANLFSAPQIDRSDTELGDTSSQSEESDRHVTTQSSLRTITPLIIAQARSNLRTLITNSFQLMPSSPPLLQRSDHFISPRSCNISRLLPVQETMESKMHKENLLHRLDRLTRSEELSILPLGLRSNIAPKKPISSDNDIDRFPPKNKLLTHSPGLNTWSSRRCYEDRVLVWTREEESGDVYCTRVTGSEFGVAAIEFSESLELLAGLVPEGHDEEFVPPISSASNSVPASGSIQVTRTPDAAKLTPSPARVIKSPTPLERQTPVDASVAAIAAPAKRGVRFAEDDKDDQIPLGYVLRIKKKREEKAKFLREERERRIHEEEKRRQEEDRQKREAERREWEKEPARARREASRAGQSFVPPSPARQPERSVVRQPSYSRPQYGRSSSQRQHVPELVLSSPNPSPNDGSPVSSRPPSITGALPATPVSQRGFSRPPSVYSAHTLSSSEDVRARDGRRVSKRNSMIGDFTKQPLSPHMQPNFLPYPSQWGSIPPVPVLPSMPFYAVDMPLLPPSPPFMMQQYGRPRSYNNSSQGQLSQSSPRQSTASLPRNNSVERMSNRSSPSSPHTSLPHHQRRSSDEAVTRTVTQKPSIDRRLGSQPDLRDKRSSTLLSSPGAYPASGLRQAYRPPPVSMPMHAVPTGAGARPTLTMQRRQSVIS
ncbi:hypothetical protein SERLA73DRAFT_71036 [Serpula lacrymans var. lacrymans S7.3]|uniref:Uncharacterized protein n=1 Tax=Serpula lacrymans var. lacrymans (strain S7.3) TaxID=936435 RepID=F8PNZ9_SERL3|nr:hypothetical protein SERLA73DRAFT_71036 [Serpula lacrymans var. lacrymans S7.3]